MLGTMMGSKYFWMLVFFLVPFFAAWIMWGLTAAVFVIMGMCMLGVAILTGGAKKRRGRYYDSYHEDYGGYGDYDGPGEQTIRLVSRRRCPKCHGSGEVGRRLMRIQIGAPGIPQTMTCPYCDGAGEVVD